MKKILKTFRIIVAMLLLGPLWVLVSGEASFDTDWRNATHNTTHQAPDPATTKEAVVHIYAARSFSWRGAFGVHTWIAAKPENADAYTRYEVIGWRKYHRLPVVSIGADYPPDAQWFGAAPTLLREFRGSEAMEIIKQLPAAAESYGYEYTYYVWPGPNSNSFTAHVARQIPALRLEMPANAIGKDFFQESVIAPAPSGTGWQVSLFGIVGILLAEAEGLEINILSLVIGFDFDDGALKVPGIGAVKLFDKGDK